VIPGGNDQLYEEAGKKAACFYCAILWLFSAPSCNHFGRHGEWKKYLATKILVKVANWRRTD